MIDEDPRVVIVDRNSKNQGALPRHSEDWTSDLSEQIQELFASVNTDSLVAETPNECRTLMRGWRIGNHRDWVSGCSSNRGSFAFVRA